MISQESQHGLDEPKERRASRSVRDEVLRTVEQCKVSETLAALTTDAWSCLAIQQLFRWSSIQNKTEVRIMQIKLEGNQRKQISVHGKPLCSIVPRHVLPLMGGDV